MNCKSIVLVVLQYKFLAQHDKWSLSCGFSLRKRFVMNKCNYYEYEAFAQDIPSNPPTRPRQGYPDTGHSDAEVMECKYVWVWKLVMLGGVS